MQSWVLSAPSRTKPTSNNDGIFLSERFLVGLHLHCLSNESVCVCAGAQLAILSQFSLCDVRKICTLSTHLPTTVRQMVHFSLNFFSHRFVHQYIFLLPYLPVLQYHNLRNGLSRCAYSASQKLQECFYQGSDAEILGENQRNREHTWRYSEKQSEQKELPSFSLRGAGEKQHLPVSLRIFGHLCNHVLAPLPHYCHHQYSDSMLM